MSAWSGMRASRRNFAFRFLDDKSTLFILIDRFRWHIFLYNPVLLFLFLYYLLFFFIDFEDYNRRCEQRQ